MSVERRPPLSEEEEKAQTQRIIMRAAKLLGVEPDTLTEEEAGKVLQDMVMQPALLKRLGELSPEEFEKYVRGGDIRIRKALKHKRNRFMAAKKRILGS